MADIVYITRVTGTFEMNGGDSNGFYNGVLLNDGDFHWHHYARGGASVSISGEGVSLSAKYASMLHVHDVEPIYDEDNVFQGIERTEKVRYWWIPNFDPKTWTPYYWDNLDGDFELTCNRVSGSETEPYVYETTVTTPLATVENTYIQPEFTWGSWESYYVDPGPQRISLNLNSELYDSKVTSSRIRIEWSNGVVEELNPYDTETRSTYEVWDENTKYFYDPPTYSGSKPTLEQIKSYWLIYMNSLYDFSTLVRDNIVKDYPSGLDVFADFDETNWRYVDLYNTGNYVPVGNYELIEFKNQSDFIQDHGYEVNEYKKEEDCIKIGWYGVDVGYKGRIKVWTPPSSLLAPTSNTEGKVVDMYVDKFGVPWVAWINNTRDKIYIANKIRKENYGFAVTVADADSYSHITSFIGGIGVDGDGSRIYVTAMCIGEFDDNSQYHIFEWETDSEAMGDWSAPRQVDNFA